MDKRQRLISMINASGESDNNWFQSTHTYIGGEYDPTYIEYMNLRHRLGFEVDTNIDANEPPLKDGEDIEICDDDGTLASDVGELADNNRAMWRKWIDEHRNDDILDGLI